MEGAKKKEFGDPVNAKIQRKFDLVFGAAPVAGKQTAALDDDFPDLVFDGDSSMSESAKKENSSPKIDLDFGADESAGGGLEFNSSTSDSTSDFAAKKESTGKLSIVPDETQGLEFNLDFGDDSAEVPSVPGNTASAQEAPVSPPVSSKEATKSDSHFELDMSGADDDHVIETRPSASSADTASHDGIGLEMDALFDAEIENAASKVELKSGTQPTIVYDKSTIDIEMDSFGDIETTASTNSSADLMTTEEAKANIESTIKDIIRPKPTADSTQEFALDGLAEKESSGEIPAMDFSANHASVSESTGEFDLSSVEFADKEEEVVARPVQDKTEITAADAPIIHQDRTHTSFVSDEESSRFQATIRQLREERDGLLNEIKMLKGESRELEQDNLTLKAALDEAKIEVSILRKRQMVEMEDMRYRLAMNEEKRALAEEKAKNAEARREKLEQRVRIDFNQVKQREKELETKLEMLSIDVDSQVHSRDQKILELRRKIDSLEFNMENVSIREQKSQDDKRKLEDKLNKIMKTLRHSIKNLEDDIDQVTDEERDDKDNDSQKSKT